MLDIILTVLGVFAISGNNAQYPTYKNYTAFQMEYESQGPSFYGYNDLLYATNMKIHFDADIYYNGYNSQIQGETPDFLIKNMHMSATLYWYNSLNDGTWYDIDTNESTTYISFGGEVTYNNIDSYSPFVSFELTDVVDWKIYNPLGHNGHGEEWTGGLWIPFESNGTQSYKYTLKFNQLKYTLTQMCRQAYSSSNQYGKGWDDGYNQGVQDGKEQGSAESWQEGYTQGFTDADNYDETALVIFDGILSIGLLPVNFFLAILNFEVFDINIGAFVSALLTVAIIVIIVRMVVSGGNGGDS